jgi:ribonucleoside-diphosphate reductase alpha chain
VDADTIDPVTATIIDGTAGHVADTANAGDTTAAGLQPHQDRTAASPVPAGQPLARSEPRDAPYCYQCGNAMQRAGSCYVCGSCGTTSGCS